MKNVVIYATGGGVILNKQNIENLRKTGVILICLDFFSYNRNTRLEEAKEKQDRF